ncbi:hypothetical protein GA0115251_116725 [Streptomyces sp. TverLS-915]|nr:hypothetical protein GA0115251_116725 [Streptomyces sp. TverLS-915]
MPVKAARAGDPEPPEGRVPGRRPMTRLCTRPVRIRGRSRAACRAGRGRSRRGWHVPHASRCGATRFRAVPGPASVSVAGAAAATDTSLRTVGEEALRTSAATPPRPSTFVGPIRVGRLRASLVSPLTLPPSTSTAPPTGATSRGPAPVLPSSPWLRPEAPASPSGALTVRAAEGKARSDPDRVERGRPCPVPPAGVGNLFAALGVPLNTLWKGLRWIRAQATWGAPRSRRLVPRGVHPSRHVPTCRCGGWCVRMSGRGWPSCSRVRVRGVCVLLPWCFWCRACGGSRCRCWSSIKWPGPRGGLPVALFPVIREGGSWTMRC